MIPRTLSHVTIRVAGVEDAAMLASLAERTFVHTFGADNTSDDMAMYVADAFGDARQRAEIEDPRITVLVAERDGGPAGYAVLRDGDVPAFVGSERAIEIARLYAATELIGAGVGAALMQRCLDEGAARGKDVVWLGVWERNPRAIAFYARWGFRDVGMQTFVLGRDVQTDRVMARDVEARV